ncbi:MULTISPECIES: ANR family transcriptional regulator [Serratia]|uniref:ANR family transcriptional regulator n=1 Tax=Serratia TaxID=613 RepID=UPI0010DC169F|nr:hypothetical protein BSR03_27035 [Serratia proteamaculans]
MEAATAAVQHEKVGRYDQAALFWLQAENLAFRPANQTWAAMRAEVCEKRHVLRMTPEGSK